MFFGLSIVIQLVDLVREQGLRCNQTMSKSHTINLLFHPSSLTSACLWSCMSHQPSLPQFGGGDLMNLSSGAFFEFWIAQEVS